YEYGPGRTFREALRAGELKDAEAVEAGAQICAGLAHAHAAGILHRDVKPSNVLLADGARVSVRLLDFGLAQIQEAETLTAAGDVPGTLAYISPERLSGAPATPASDVWAVGVMLWEALAGYHPFWTASLLETARAIEAGAPPLASVRADLPKPLAAAVDRAPAPAPARRPAAAELVSALRGAAPRPRRRRTTPSITVPVARAEVGAAPLLAATFAGGSAALLPFFPGWWWVALALAAAATTAWRERIGLAVALAVPVLPLGNVSLGLALLYPARAPLGLGIANARGPLDVAGSLWHALAAHAALGIEAAALATAAALLPYARARGRWGGAALGTFLLVTTVLLVPTATAVPLVLT